MRVISKFHDFYDGIRAYGFDPKIIYIRKTEEISLNHGETYLIFRSFPLHVGMTEDLITQEISLLFCGKVYRGVAFKYKEEEKIIWSLDNFKKYYRSYEPSAYREHYLEQYFTPEDKPELTEICIKYKTPCIYISRLRFLNELQVMKDIKLSSINFQKVMDSFTTYQQLAIFVGNVLIEQNKPIWPISDDLKAQSKGFDKWSFRKRPK